MAIDSLPGSAADLSRQDGQVRPVPCEAHHHVISCLRGPVGNVPANMPRTDDSQSHYRPTISRYQLRRSPPRKFRWPVTI